MLGKRGLGYCLVFKILEQKRKDVAVAVITDRCVFLRSQLVRVTTNLELNCRELRLDFFTAFIDLQVAISNLRALGSTSTHIILNMLAKHFMY